MWKNIEKYLISNRLRYTFFSFPLLISLFCFHQARHTFATTVVLNNGGSIEALSKMMGHKNITTTQIYAKITNEKISRDVERIIGNLNDLQGKLRTGA